MPRIIVRHGGVTWHHPLADKKVTVGCASDCDIRLSDRSVAPAHCSIHCHGDDWVIEHEAADHQTMLNGRFVNLEALRNGDRIQVGACELVFDADFATEQAYFDEADGAEAPAPQLMKLCGACGESVAADARTCERCGRL